MYRGSKDRRALHGFEEHVRRHKENRVGKLSRNNKQVSLSMTRGIGKELRITSNNEGAAPQGASHSHFRTVDGRARLTGEAPPSTLPALSQRTPRLVQQNYFAGAAAQKDRNSNVRIRKGPQTYEYRSVSVRNNAPAAIEEEKTATASALQSRLQPLQAFRRDSRCLRL